MSTTPNIRQAIHEAIVKGQTIETGLTQTGTSACVLADSVQTVTGAKTFSGTTTVSGSFVTSGAFSPSAGVSAASTFIASPRCLHTGGIGMTVATQGTNNATTVATTMYVAEVFVPCNVSVTGVAVFNGTAVAGNGKMALFSVSSADGTSGTRVAVTASTAMTGAAQYQLIAFTGGPIAVKGPATYFIGCIYDTTTHDLRAHAANCGSFATGTLTGLTYATDSTFATATMPTTFTGDVGPIASLY